MTSTHHIDNDEPLFQFDPYDTALTGALLDDLPTFLHQPSHTSPSNHDLTLPHSLDITPTPLGKGKAVSVPLPIPAPSAFDQAHDIFDMSPSSSSSSSSRAYPRRRQFPSRIDTHSIHTPIDDLSQIVVSSRDDDPPRDTDVSHHDVSLGKGKARELPPVLPPLVFSPTAFDYGEADWPSPSQFSSTPGPSSYGSGYGSPDNAVLLHTPQEQQQFPQVAQQPDSKAPTIRRIPSRRRSFSSLSIRSTRSLAARSVSRLKLGASKMPSALARRLLFRKRHDTADAALDPQRHLQNSDPSSIGANPADLGHRSRFMSWRGDIRSRSRPSSDIVVNFDSLTSPAAGALAVSGRSFSLPYPQSFLDIIVPECSDIFTPLSTVILNHFAQLPSELQLRIFSSLVVLHELEHARREAQGQWTVLKASSSRNQWVGQQQGIRELVKFSRVCKAWQALVFDGQLWINLNLRAFPAMPASLITRLTNNAGAFIQTVDFRGHARLQTTTLSELIGNLCPKPAPLGGLSCTQLTSVTLQGCTALTTRSLHHLLIRSPLLERLCLKGLGAVTNTTCDVLAAYCPRLISLDLGRCTGMNGNGLLSLAAAALSRGERLLLKELRLCGLKHVDDEIMSTLGRAAPHLEVLDLSYARQLHNSALQAFVSVREGDDLADSILLTARAAGREASDSRKYRRRVTRIRHLSLSCCVLLTDIACSNLAHSMPNLEFLELAGIGAELKDDGLVRLLRTTPLIRKLDLEDATEITNDVLTAITPIAPVPGTEIPVDLQPGHALEHLIVSYASNLTDEGLLSLIRNCPKLKVLEADNTSMSSHVMREFVQLARGRRTINAKVVAIDCRGVTEAVVREMAGMTRPRLGWRAYEARKLRFLDGRDKEELKVGQDECDETRVVLKTFYSWQTVDQVKAARLKKRKASSRRAMSDSNGSVSDGEDTLTSTGRARWWTPSAGRRMSGANSPTALDANFNDSCRIM